MALKIPIYDAPQVKQQAAPNVGLNLQVPNLGAPLAEGLNQVASVYQREVQKLDALRVEDARNKLAVQSEIAKNSIAAKKGEAAFKLVDGESPYLNEENLYKDSVATIRKDLTPRQAAEFDRIAAGEFTRLGVYTEAHRSNETDRYEKGVKEGTVLRTKNDLDVAIATGNKDIVAEATKNYQQALAALQPGIPTEQAQAEAVSKAYLKNVAAIVKGGGVVGGEDGPNAHLYARMSEEDRKEAKRIVTQGDADNESTAFVNSTFTPTMTRTEARKLSVEKFPDNPKAQLASVALFNNRINETADDMKDAGKALLSEVSVAAKTKPGSINRLITRVESTISLPKPIRDDIVLRLENMRKTGDTPEEVMELRRRAVLFTADPKFKTLTLEEATAQAMNFGLHNFDMVVSAHKTATADGGNHTPHAAVVKAVQNEVFGKKMTADQTVDLQDAVNKVSAKHEVMFSKSGKGAYAATPWTADEWTRQILAEIQPRKTGVFGKVSFMDATPQDFNDMVKKIPTDERRVVSLQLATAGIRSADTTDEQVARVHADLMYTKKRDLQAYLKLYNEANKGASK